MDVRTRTAALALGIATTAAVVTGGTSLAGAGQPGTDAAVPAAAPPTDSLRLDPSSAQLKACFPKAHAHVDVTLTTDSRGKDTVKVRLEHVKPRTSFTIFLLEQAGAPFGAAEYIGDVTTDGDGDATNTFTLIAEEAFAFNGSTLARTDLNSVGMWFADPKDDNGCLGTSSPVTGFDGDASAGVQMLNSGAAKLP